MLSCERQSHLVHLVVNDLREKNLIQCKDLQAMLMLARKTMTACMKECEEMDYKVRQKIMSLKRNVTENSSEWEVLYSNYLEDEMTRRGLASIKER